VAELRVEGSKDTWYVLAEDLARLDELEAGRIPQEWQPLETTSLEEAVPLAPLDIVSARGRAKWLFDFDYIWEVYKPAHLRRWGYYTLPILYGDRLVARIDARLERPAQTNGSGKRRAAKDSGAEDSGTDERTLNNERGSSGNLRIEGFWHEGEEYEHDGDFHAALGRGLRRFAAFLNASSVDASNLHPAELRRQVEAACEAS